MTNNKILRLTSFVLALSLLSLIACQREAKAPPGAVKIDDNAI